MTPAAMWARVRRASRNVLSLCVAAVLCVALIGLNKLFGCSDDENQEV